MDIYMYGSPETPASTLAQTFMDIAELQQSGFLSLDDTVWANADAPELGLWTLTDKSSFTYLVKQVYAGWARITKDQVRWGRTAPDTTQQPSVVLKRKNFPGDQERPATIVFTHRDPKKNVRVLHDGNARRLPGGIGTFGEFTIVDNTVYNRNPDLKPNAYDQAHAMINGVALMSATMGISVRRKIMDNIDAFRLDYTEEHVNVFSQPRSIAEEYADIQIQSVLYNIDQLGLSGDTSNIPGALTNTEPDEDEIDYEDSEIIEEMEEEYDSED